MPTPVRLLVVEDDPASRKLLVALFTAEGFEVIDAADGERGVERALEDAPALVLLDLQLPKLDGLEVLEKVMEARPGLPVVMVTAQHDVKAAVKASKLGAFDYLTKPVDHDEVVMVVRRALETRALQLEVEDLRRRVAEGGGLLTRMGSSKGVRELAQQVAAVAASSFTVLVLGETGTGKELVAQAIHRQSPRRDAPFIAIDCGAIPEPLLESELFGHERGAFTGAERKQKGRFELAQGGTLFLDEVGNLPLGLQAKLLRVLESRQVQAVGGERAEALDVRFVAATNDDLNARVAAGQFRADLYYRLAQYTLNLPPLRDRPDDVGYLAQRFLEEAAVELRRPVQRLAAGALEALERHAWPGNVRELRNVVRQGVLRAVGAELSRHDVREALGNARVTAVEAPTLAGTRTLKQIALDAAQAAERAAICDTLKATKGNQAKAARALQTDYKTLHLKLKQLGIRARDFSP